MNLAMSIQLITLLLALNASLLHAKPINSTDSPNVDVVPTTHAKLSENDPTTVGKFDFIKYTKRAY